MILRSRFRAVVALSGIPPDGCRGEPAVPSLRAGRQGAMVCFRHARRLHPARLAAAGLTLLAIAGGADGPDGVVPAMRDAGSTRKEGTGKLVYDVGIRPFTQRRVAAGAAAECGAPDRFEPVEWRLGPGGASRRDLRLSLPAPGGPGEALVLVARIDPVVDPAGNDGVEVVVSLGVPEDANADPRQPIPPRVAVTLRDRGADGDWALWLDGTNVTGNPPDRGNYDGRADLQRPDIFAQPPGPVYLRLVLAPEEGRTLVRLYAVDPFRPVEEHRIDGCVTATCCAIVASAGEGATTAAVRIEDVSARIVAATAALAPATPAEAVMAALNLECPALLGVKEALVEGRSAEARARFLLHMRSRREPKGSGLDDPLLTGANWQEIADEALRGRYGTKGFGAGFSDQFVDPDGTLRWERDNGFLNRHFHWCSLAKAFEASCDARYARRFALEVRDWVAREPFLAPKSPHVGGIDYMDGTVFKRGWMNTSNIGRRCELTWWPAYEVFRKSGAFDDEAHFAMLLGFLRQSRLLTNPTSFAWWDDGGAHGTVALLQNALMLPEMAESAAWRRIAEQRLGVVADRQFHPDGAHVSLSTGYNFASIHALEHAIALYRRCRAEVPAALIERLRRAYSHPTRIARPVHRGQVDLNDGGWGPVDDHLRTGAELFPDDEVLRWFATSGREGAAPVERSVLFPWAGHVVLRTGWGPEDLYLFMDAGPIGMSHAKEDKLTVFVDRGGTLLLGSGGRAGYGDLDGLRYTGSIHAQNTLTVDDLNHARIPVRHEYEIDAPERRRFATGAAFDYAEGFHTHGWHGATHHVAGRHTRRVVLVKGRKPPQTSFFLVLDEIRFDDGLDHVVEALWHPTRNETRLVDDGLAAESCDAGGAIRIEPLLCDGLDARLVTGQTTPHRQGWIILGEHRKAVPCVIHRWTARGTTRRAWLLLPAPSAGAWAARGGGAMASGAAQGLRIRLAGGGICEAEWTADGLRLRERDARGADVAQFETPVEPNTP